MTTQNKNKNIEYGASRKIKTPEEIDAEMKKLVRLAESKVKGDAPKESAAATRQEIKEKKTIVEAKFLSPTEKIKPENPSVEAQLIAPAEKEQEITKPLNEEKKEIQKPIVETQFITSPEQIETKNPPVETQFIASSEQGKGPKPYTEKTPIIIDDEGGKTKKEKQLIVSKENLRQNFYEEDIKKPSGNIEQDLLKTLTDNAGNIINDLLKKEGKSTRTEKFIVNNFVDLKNTIQENLDDIIVIAKGSKTGTAKADIYKKSANKIIGELEIDEDGYKVNV